MPKTLLLAAVLLVLAAVFIHMLRGHLAERERLEKKRLRKEQKAEMARAAAKRDAEAPAKVIDRTTQPAKPRRGRPSTVLLVEDSPTMMLALRKILERWGYRVLSAGDGRQAWAELQKQKPDIVVSDIDMPELNGIELLKLMRSDLVLVDMPVILITGDPVLHHLADQQAQANGLLAKPFEDRALIDQIRYLLQE